MPCSITVGACWTPLLLYNEECCSDYYCINNTLHDGLTYVLYVNGGNGHAFWLLTMLSTVFAVVCMPIKCVLRFAQSARRYLLQNTSHT